MAETSTTKPCGPEPTQPLRILVVEDHESFRRRVCSMLEKRPELRVIGEARRIHQLSPESKIVFLSSESTADVVEEAFSVGAVGYVVKSDAGRDLLPAVESVRKGRQFVSSGLSDLYARRTYLTRLRQEQRLSNRIK
jgi:DNA-binding NarL/FixJ family response regulator